METSYRHRGLTAIFPPPCRLESWQYEEWGSQVTVVSCDMREWEAPEKADLMVSELLGSFADNELSPECLDGAEHCLKGEVRDFGRQGLSVQGGRSGCVCVCLRA